MSQLVPENIRTAVLLKIQQEADEIGWDSLTQIQKTDTITRWIRNPNIGGILGPLLGGDAEIRVWLKDVALRQRARNRQPGAIEVASRLFPIGFELVPGTAKDKPPQCTVRVSDCLVFVCWGVRSNAKHLFWAALNKRVSRDQVDRIMVVLVDRGSSVTPPDEVARYESLANVCGVNLAWIRL